MIKTFNENFNENESVFLLRLTSVHRTHQQTALNDVCKYFLFLFYNILVIFFSSWSQTFLIEQSRIKSSEPYPRPPKPGSSLWIELFKSSNPVPWTQTQNRNQKVKKKRKLETFVKKLRKHLKFQWLVASTDGPHLRKGVQVQMFSTWGPCSEHPNSFHTCIHANASVLSACWSPVGCARCSRSVCLKSDSWT